MEFVSRPLGEWMKSMKIYTFLVIDHLRERLRPKQVRLPRTLASGLFASEELDEGMLQLSATKQFAAARFKLALNDA